MPANVFSVRNVNEALYGLAMADMSSWRVVAPRGMRTHEHPGPLVTEFMKPWERVLFSSVRDANPFFHFFESLWMLAGREDVKYLTRFNPRMAEFSDNGNTFHAPYGYRLRRYDAYMSDDGLGLDQLIVIINMLRKDPDTRQAVATIWNANEDLNAKTKDMPCNDMLFFKIRNGELHMTILCRSNDAIWGAYGANAVHFSMIMEFVARSVGVGMGSMVQVSDSFHVYDDNEVWKRIREESETGGFALDDRYAAGNAGHYGIMANGGDPVAWLKECEHFVAYDKPWDNGDPFFVDVAQPLLSGWDAWKRGNGFGGDAAIKCIEFCKASDWRMACIEWIERRMK